MNHRTLRLSFEVVTEAQGSKLIIRIYILSANTGNRLTRAIDLAYMEDGRKFVRNANNLWKSGYYIQCPVCDQQHFLKLSVINALVILGEGMIKAQDALLNAQFDRIDLN